MMTRFNQDADEAIQELEVLSRWCQTKGVDGDRRSVHTHAHIAPRKQARKGLIASTQIEDYGERMILLQVGQQKAKQERLACSGGAQDHSMCVVLVVEIQKIGSPLVGLEHCEIFLVKMW